MRARDYGDIFAGRPRRTVPEIPAEVGLVAEDPGSGFCGAVVRIEAGPVDGTVYAVVLEDRHGRHRLFPMRPAAFLVDGEPATLVRPPAQPAHRTATRSASGSTRVDGLRARVAREGRIWVEGVHDATLVERVWGHDLRVEGVVVQQLDGIDDLPAAITDFGTTAHRRLGVLVDHLVAGSKESRIVAAIDDPNVLVTGHPYVDIWQAVKPEALGIDAWPTIDKGIPWKEGVCAALHWDGVTDGWRRVNNAVRSYRDLQTPLIGAVEQLIDFVTVGE